MWIVKLISVGSQFPCMLSCNNSWNVIKCEHLLIVDECSGSIETFLTQWRSHRFIFNSDLLFGNIFLTRHKLTVQLIWFLEIIIWVKLCGFNNNWFSCIFSFKIGDSGVLSGGPQSFNVIQCFHIALFIVLVFSWLRIIYNIDLSVAKFIVHYSFWTNNCNLQQVTQLQQFWDRSESTFSIWIIHSTLGTQYPIGLRIVTSISNTIISL